MNFDKIEATEKRMQKCQMSKGQSSGRLNRTKMKDDGDKVVKRHFFPI